MPLIPYDARGANFVLVTPKNAATKRQGNGGLAITADSVAVGSLASKMEFDNHSKSYQSATLEALTTITITVDLGAPVSSNWCGLMGNNLDLPKGYQINQWLVDPAGPGSPVRTLGPELDTIVRGPDFFPGADVPLPPVAESNLRNSLNISPAGYPSTVFRWIEFILDVSEGNGPDDFVQVAYLYVGVQKFLLDCLAQYTVSGTPLSRPTTAQAGGVTGTPEMPLKKATMPLTFLQEADKGVMAQWLLTDEEILRAVYWPEAHDLNSWAFSAVSGIAGRRGWAFKQRSRSTAALETLELDEVR